MVYNLLHYEGLFVGASSALNMVGAVKTAEAVGKGKTVGKNLGRSRMRIPRFAATRFVPLRRGVADFFERYCCVVDTYSRRSVVDGEEREVLPVAIGGHCRVTVSRGQA